MADPVRLSVEEQIYALTTWRYLRLALVGLPLALFAAIGSDLIRGHDDVGGSTRHCLEGSISAYYYTPVHAFMIGALVAVGVSLYCLRGETPLEDALLNLAGMFAPVVALVPTDAPTTCPSSAVTIDRAASTGNSMVALLVLETAAAVTLLVLVKRNSTPQLGDDRAAPTRADFWGFVVAGVVIAAEWVLWVVSLRWPHVWGTPVHYTAAVGMFVWIFVVVCVRAGVKRPGHRFRWHLRHPSLEALVAIGMVVSAGLAAIAQWVLHWNFAAFAVEFALIALFIVFWVVQTVRGWHPGLGAAAEDLPEWVRVLSAPRP